jgi:myo-inositol-1-phosphate synthase
MKPIRIAIAGIGNCASSLLQGLSYYSRPRPNRAGSVSINGAAGLLHDRVGGYAPADIRLVAAFDVDARKVGKTVDVAAIADPNCTTRFVKRLSKSSVRVQMGPVLDGVAPHMSKYPEGQTFVISKSKPVNLAKALGDSGAEILLSYLPVGSQKATAAYAEACLSSGVSLINCMPVFIASEPRWAARFTKAGIPLIGDDVKGQVGATILHRALAQLFMERGAAIDKTYQLNVGGNTDFLNMLNRTRLKSKKISKTEAVQTVFPYPLEGGNIHIGPSESRDGVSATARSSWRHACQWKIPRTAGG